MARRHIPQRTCVACRSIRPKREMVRVVRAAAAAPEAPDRVVFVDPSGKRSGRGAYLCRAAECWQQALKRDVLSRALKTELTAADRGALEEFGERLRASTTSAGEADPATRAHSEEHPRASQHPVESASSLKADS